MKKFLSIILSFIFLLSFNTFCFADNTGSTSNIDEKYNLKTIDKIPEGVTPIEINSEKELQEFLESVSSTNDLHVEITDNPIISSRVKRSSDYITRRASKVEKTGFLGSVKFELYGNVKIYAQSNSFKQIEGVSGMGLSISGYTYGVDIRDSSVRTDYDISSDKQSVTLTGEGDVDYYIVYQGIGKYMTLHKNMSFVYSL